MAFIGSLEDRILIRERMGSYADAAFRGDPQAWLENWVEECVWATAAFNLRGKPALLEQWQNIWSSLKAMAFFTEIGSIEIQGDRAHARCYCREVVGLERGGYRKYVGRYDDELVRHKGQWLFKTRSYAVLMDEGQVGPVLSASVGNDSSHT